MLRGVKIHGFRQITGSRWFTCLLEQHFRSLLKAINYAYENGRLSVSQRRGVIRLIPRKDSDPHFIKNWRPITLLNCDYKIAAKAIANRVKKVLPNILNEDQTGFIKGRTIGENIKLIN